jgi:hypothetical protein
MVLPHRNYVVPRSSPRTFMHAAAEVKSTAIQGTHVGVVRDLSEEGMFFYSDFKPPIGTELRIAFVPPAAGVGARIYCEGVVVRVEQVRMGAAPGIAVRLTHKKPAMRASA